MKDKGFFFLIMYVIQHCFIRHPSDSTVSKDAAGIEPRGMLVSNPGMLESNQGILFL